jgi:hypothetical protein
MGGELFSEELETIPELYKKIFIESGTYKGDTSLLASRHFPEVITIEIFKPLYDEAKEKLKETSNVTQYLGDSVEILNEDDVYGKYKYGGVFFLDGHISGHDSSYSSEHPVPLLKELEVLTKRYLGPSLIIIDDVRLWEQGHWQTVTKEKILACFNPGQVKCAYVKNDRFWIYTNSCTKTC